MNAKSIKINHTTKGVVTLGSLSKNELCRGVSELLQENVKIQGALNVIVGNIQASADAV